MPSYLPILAALVAVYAESHHGEGGYYQALRHALHLPPQWGPLDLAQLDELWDDLDAWSGPKGTAGRYGRLRLAVHGQQKYVGRLRAQCIFRSIDVERIARVFAQVRVQPGEELSLETAARLRVAICDDPALSIGLREAAKDENYAEILTERLQQILGDWDGWVPAVGRGGVHDGGEPTAVEAGRDCAVSHELRLSLHLTHNDVPWRVGWRIACLGDDVRVTLEYDEHRWDAVLRENEEVTATPAGHGNGALLELALQNGRVCLKCDRPKVGALIFRHKLLRYLVWEPHENCLVERDQLPSYGPAYLLRGPDNVNFQRVVSAHRVELQRCPQDGLPIGWELWHVPDCGRLKEVPWPDGYDVHPQPRVLRLVGGVRIRRGGRLLFLPYDLPRVELDAPPETQVTATGLKLVPEPEGTVQEGLHATSLRRFWMTVIDGSRQHFLIEARRANGEVMGSATLRVHTGVAPLSALGDETGLDPSGGSTSREPFLVGVTLRGWNGSSPEPSKFDVAPKDLGQPLEAGWPTPRIRAIAEMRFLDSLAQASIASIPYGVARDRLRRYLQETSSTERVAPLFRDLRSRGLVEIVTDSRGRWTAVAKVRPTLFRLPIVAGHQEVWAVAGTLGFSHPTLFTARGREHARMCAWI